MADLDELRTFNAALEELLGTQPSIHTVEPEVTRRRRRAGEGIFPAPVFLDQATTRNIDGPAGYLPLRVLVPDRVDGVYLHIHGGGWTLGEHDTSDVALWATATAANVAVVSVGYRLAPEHPWPDGPDDCEAAARWLIEHAAAEFGTEKLLIGGESAGAHLCVVTLLRLRDRHGIGDAFRAANLVYGAYDLSLTPSVRRWGDRNLVLSTPIIEWFVNCFLPGKDPEARRDPDVSPLYADLRGMPPALFTVGTLDPLLDDNLFMEARWRLAGNSSELHLVEEAVHGFNLFPLMASQEENAAQSAFLRSAI